MDKIQIARNAMIRVDKSYKKGLRYRITKYCLFDVATGKDLMYFDMNCPKCFRWEWYKYMNLKRGVGRELIYNSLPKDERFEIDRINKIRSIHKTIERKRTYYV